MSVKILTNVLITMAVTPVNVKMDMLTLEKAQVFQKTAWTSTNVKQGHMIVEIIKNAKILLARFYVHVSKGSLRVCQKTMVMTTMSTPKRRTKKMLTLEN